MSRAINEDAQSTVDVLAAHKARLEAIREDSMQLQSAMEEMDEFLALRGILIDEDASSEEETSEISTQRIKSWSEIVAECSGLPTAGSELGDLLTAAELEQCDERIHELNAKYKAVHRLDKTDVAISAFASVVSASVDILLVGVPEKTKDGIREAPLGNYIRDQFERAFPPDEVERLASQARSKVPYDAQDNRSTTQYVDGLSAYYHRLLSLGHDPLLGLFVGVHDILTGKMTTIDKAGNFVSQVMEGYADRTAKDVFSAVCKQVLHFMSDVNTSMGLPAPLMGLFNVLQFGKFGTDEQTVAEIVQGMYFEGYDFVHFVSQTIPVMLTEVIVRTCWVLKRMHEGYGIKESIPVSTRHAKHPKLGTMLFVAHAATTAINAGNVYFAKNPLAINYPQWIAFSIYLFKQAKWILVDKPNQQDDYVLASLGEETARLLAAGQQRIGSTQGHCAIIL